VNVVPELVPISEIRKRQNEILIQLQDSPVILTQRGRAAAVMVNPQEWNRLVNKLKDLEEALEETLDVRAAQEMGARIIDSTDAQR
jgi:PHD/YefM family antitoxin component YafN of YafNO toxin-antitoxin module